MHNILRFFFLFKIYKRLKGVPEIETRLLKCFSVGVSTQEAFEKLLGLVQTNLAKPEGILIYTIKV